MLGSIKYNLSHLFDFHGRDARQTFWYYVLFLVVAKIAVGLLVAMPLYIAMFSGAFEAARAGVDQEGMQAMMVAGMADQLRIQMMIGVVIGLVASLLFAAAFVRRLHDSGKPGWIVLLALLPYLGTLAYNLINIDSVIATVEHAMAAKGTQDALADQSRLYSQSLVAWIGYVVVIAFGVMKSDGPNRYGEEPVRF